MENKKQNETQISDNEVSASQNDQVRSINMGRIEFDDGTQIDNNQDDNQIQGENLAQNTVQNNASMRQQHNSQNSNQNSIPNQSEEQPHYQAQGVPIETMSDKQQRVGMIWGIIAIIVGAMSAIFAPIILGPAGIIMGNIALNKGAKSLGKTAIIVSVVCMIAGLIFVIVYVMKMQQTGIMAPPGGFILNAFSGISL